jgi:spore maturation protein CgeB
MGDDVVRAGEPGPGVDGEQGGVAGRLRAELAESRAELERLRGEVAGLEQALAAERRGGRDSEPAAEASHGPGNSLRESLRTEQSLRRKLQQQVSSLKEQLRYTKATLELRENEVRYRLGDALIRALRPSKDTLLLPVRLAQLLGTGLARAWARRREAAVRRAAATPTGGRAALAASCGGQPVDMEAAPLLPAYARVPEEQVARRTLCIAGVMDEFSWRAWQYEADLYTFTPQDWQRAMEARPPDLLLVESAWSGLRDSWQLQVRDLGRRGGFVRRYALPEMLAWCRQRGIPTVFYNKEDPANFDVFIEAAQLFDYVFTSDANCCEDYRKHLKHERVFALPFAAQPRIHNPRWVPGARTETVCFAGTWYAHRHFNRQDEAEVILKPALSHGLHVYDRMAAVENDNYRWPIEYEPALRGALSYAQMLVAYKRYKVFLNVNSVADSPTMFARRVFELLACGTPVVSAYSLGIERLLGGDVVQMSEDAETTGELLVRLLGDGEYRERLALRGQRRVFGEHTYGHRLEELLRVVGLGGHALRRPKFLVVTPVERAEEVAAAVESFRRQHYQEKEFVLCGMRGELGQALSGGRGPAGQGVRVLAREGATWSGLLAEALGDVTADFVVLMRTQDHYGADYLTDYAHASLYVDDLALGKASYYQRDGAGVARVVGGGQEYRSVAQVCPATLCLRGAQARRLVKELPADLAADEWWQRAVAAVGQVYSSDRFNYVRQEGVAEPVGAIAGGDKGGQTASLQAALV